MSSSPAEAVTRFLNAMADGDIDTALGLVDDNIVYTNVSLPTIRGRTRLASGLRAFSRLGMRFEVAVHRIAENGTSVLTERTDALLVGPVRIQFWVCGVFEVDDDRVTLWRDYFDWGNITRGALRGLVGVVVPSVRAKLPAPR